MSMLEVGNSIRSTLFLSTKYIAMSGNSQKETWIISLKIPFYEVASIILVFQDFLEIMTLKWL